MSNLKKAIIAGAVLAASSSLAVSAAFANGGQYVPPPEHPHTVYVGIGVSRDFVHYETHQGDFVRYTNAVYGANYVASRHWADFGSDGWDGEIFAGIGWTFQDHYYLGAEIFGSISNNEADGTWTYYQPAYQWYRVHKHFELEHSYGISFIPGVKISPSTMLYGRIGWIRADFQVTDSTRYSGAYLAANNALASWYNTRIHRSKDEDALELGIGLETMVTNNVSARIEYDWADFGSLSGSARTAVHATQFCYHRRTVKVDPTLNLAKLEVAYHFMSA